MVASPQVTRRRALFGAAALAVLWLGWQQWGATPRAGGPGMGGLVPVTTRMVAVAPATVRYVFPARVNAHRIAEIRPQVGGIIQKRLFEEGAVVKKGQPLYQIDPAPYQAAYQSALADLAKAEALVKSTQAKVARTRGLVKSGAISKQDFDDILAADAQAKAEVGVAKAAVATAKINLDYTRVLAPISGQISKSSVTEGALAVVGGATALASITQTNPVYVDATLASEDMQRLRSQLARASTRATVEMDGGTTYGTEGRLQFTDITVDPSTGAVQLRSLFPNPNTELLPGMFVRLALDVTVEDAMLVPQKSTSRGADGALKIWRITPDNTAEPITITTQQTVGDQWLVSHGLTVGDPIVIEGMAKLQPGAKVSVGSPPPLTPAEADGVAR